MINVLRQALLKDSRKHICTESIKRIMNAVSRTPSSVTLSSIARREEFKDLSNSYVIYCLWSSPRGHEKPPLAHTGSARGRRSLSCPGHSWILFLEKGILLYEIFLRKNLYWRDLLSLFVPLSVVGVFYCLNVKCRFYRPHSGMSLTPLPVPARGRHTDSAFIFLPPHLSPSVYVTRLLIPVRNRNHLNTLRIFMT